jgi:hypothetical protein
VKNKFPEQWRLSGVSDREQIDIVADNEISESDNPAQQGNYVLGSIFRVCITEFE